MLKDLEQNTSVDNLVISDFGENEPQNKLKDMEWREDEEIEVREGRKIKRRKFEERGRKQ